MMTLNLILKRISWSTMSVACILWCVDQVRSQKQMECWGQIAKKNILSKVIESLWIGLSTRVRLSLW